jgi:hypothetical protein
LFPAGIVMATKLLPRHLHVSAVGFSTAIGGERELAEFFMVGPECEKFADVCTGTGGALFPFAVGAIAQAKGVQVLQPIILFLLAWLCLPQVKKQAAE